MIQFHQTFMGHRFFESQIPQLIRALKNIVASRTQRGHAKGCGHCQ